MVRCGHKFKKEDKFSLAFFFYQYFLLGLFLCLLSFQTTSPSSHQSVKKNVHIGFGLDLKDLVLFQFGKNYWRTITIKMGFGKQETLLSLIEETYILPNHFSANEEN